MNQTQRAQIPPKLLEEILVVPRKQLFKEPAWNGFKKIDFSNLVHIIETHKEFHPRYLMEQDPTFKQIIPYMIFRQNNQYFLMERNKKASEQRLKSKLTLGIGGHVRKEDLSSSDLFDWAKREFHEEVVYNDSLQVTPLGMLNDDSNEVGKVHLGLVLLLEGNSPEISIKSELASGNLVSWQDCLQAYDRMETWSQLLLSADPFKKDPICKKSDILLR